MAEFDRYALGVLVGIAACCGVLAVAALAVEGVYRVRAFLHRGEL